MGAQPFTIPDVDAYQRDAVAIDQAIAEAVDAAYRAHGYVDAAGEISPAAMHEVAYQAVATKVASGRDFHMDTAQSITRGELYAAVWPQGPAAGAQDLGFVEEGVRSKLDRDVWSLTGPSPNGKIQQRLDQEGSTLVLCRSKLTRGYDIIDAGCFVTDVPELMLAHNLKGTLDDVVKKAATAQKRIEMLLDRHPEIAAAVRTELEATLGKVRAALPAPASD